MKRGKRGQAKTPSPEAARMRQFLQELRRVVSPNGPMSQPGPSPMSAGWSRRSAESPP